MLDASDAALTFCQSLSPAPTFCADFDDGTAFGGFTNIVSSASSTLGLDSTTFLSAPRALHATTAQVTNAYYARDFAVATQLSIQFDVRFAIVPADGSAISPFVLTPPDPPGEDIYWFVDGNNSYFQEFGDDVSQSQPQPTANAWHRVQITLALAAGSSTITTSVDGTTFWNDHVLKYPWPTPTTATLRVGAARCYAASNDVYIDNVVVKAQ